MGTMPPIESSYNISHLPFVKRRGSNGGGGRGGSGGGGGAGAPADSSGSSGADLSRGATMALVIGIVVGVTVLVLAIIVTHRSSRRRRRRAERAQRDIARLQAETRNTKRKEEAEVFARRLNETQDAPNRTSDGLLVDRGEGVWLAEPEPAWKGRQSSNGYGGDEYGPGHTDYSTGRKNSGGVFGGSLAGNAGGAGYSSGDYGGGYSSSGGYFGAHGGGARGGGGGGTGGGGGGW